MTCYRAIFVSGSGLQNQNKWLKGLYSATCTVTHEKESAEIVGEMAMMMLVVGGGWQDDYWDDDVGQDDDHTKTKWQN